MALSFIGKPISLISHSDVRYRGILAGIDPAASTIQLSNVFSMGTESRRPVAEYIPPVQEPYQYIIFRASEVKDLSVDEQPAPRRSVHDDPAVLGASPLSYATASTQAPAPVAPAAQPSYAQQTAQQLPPRQQPPQVQQQQQQQQQRAPPPRQRPLAAQQNAPQAQHQNAIHTAAASLETVERALGDLRVSNANAAANAAPRRQRTKRTGAADGNANTNGVGAGGVAVPAADFDFASMNAKFDKAALAARGHGRAGSGSSDRTNPSDEEDAKDAKGKGVESPGSSAAYNPQKSFFDSLSSPPPFAPKGQQQGGSSGGGRGTGGRGRGRGGYGYNRREEERERNVATFGEPGGVGLLGPGAYVGGWGGYGGGGRRGGGRRRGPPAVARPQQQQQQQQ
ncbi:Scd6-like Sm domain-containing protein [Mycena capillaripes]|nr:Scd6-like Sm domain-containing protein [Mycena capillaripes]